MKFAKTVMLAFALASGAAFAQAPSAPANGAAAVTAAPAAVKSVPGTGAEGTTGAATPVVDKAAKDVATAQPTLAPTPDIGMPTPGAWDLQKQFTPNGRRALWMHNYVLLPVITIISLLVLFLLLWVIVRYRQRANPTPSRTSHNTVIEVIWTLVPVLILVGIAVPSIGLLAAQFKPPSKDALTIKAIGNQWYWTYQYPDNGGVEIVSNMLEDKPAAGKRARTDADGPRLLAADNRLVIPAHREIRLLTTSNDVIHSFAVPSFWIKLDAVPGRVNETSFRVDRPGVYFGQCSELCGARHAFMPIAVEVVPPAQFDAWIASKGGTVAGAKPAPAAGAAVGKPTGQAEGSTDQPTPGTVKPPVTSQGGQPNTEAK